MRFDGKFARYEMSLKEKAVKHKVLDMERRKVQVHVRVRVRQKLTVLLTLATGAGHWGLGAKRRQARVKHKAVLGDAMLPAELGDAVPCRDKLDQTGRFQIHIRRGQRRASVEF